MIVLKNGNWGKEKKGTGCLGHGGKSVPSCTGPVVSVGSLKPGSGAFPVVLPHGDGAAAMSRTAGSSSMRLSRG